MFEAADVNSDGTLSLEEFTGLLKHLKPTLTEDQVCA